MKFVILKIRWVGGTEKESDCGGLSGITGHGMAELLVQSAFSLPTLPTPRSCRLSNLAASLSGSFRGSPFKTTNHPVRQPGKDAHTESCPQASLRLLIPMEAKTTPWFFPVGTLPLSFLFSFLSLFES
jgi:hypothetical protein